MSFINPPIVTVPYSAGGPYPWSTFRDFPERVLAIGPSEWALVSQFADANYKYFVWRIVTINAATGLPQAGPYQWINLTQAPWPGGYATFPYNLNPIYDCDAEGNVWMAGTNNPFPTQPIPTGPQGSGVQYAQYGGGPGTPSGFAGPNQLPMSGKTIDGGQHKGAGNIQLCVTACDGGSFDTPPGYTAFTDYFVGGTEWVNAGDPGPSAGATYIQVFYRVTTGAENTTDTITFTGGATHPMAVIMYCWNVDGTHPLGDVNKNSVLTATNQATVPPTPSTYRSWCDRMVYIYSDSWSTSGLIGPGQNGSYQAGSGFSTVLDFFPSANRWTAELGAAICPSTPTGYYQGAFGSRAQYYNQIAIVLRGVDIQQPTPKMPTVWGQVDWHAGTVNWGPAHDTDMTPICAPVASHPGWLQLMDVQWANDHNIYMDKRASGVPAYVAKLDPHTGLLCTPLFLSGNGTNFQGIHGQIAEDYCFITFPTDLSSQYRLSRFNDTNDPPTVGPITTISTDWNGGPTQAIGALSGSVIGAVSYLQYTGHSLPIPFAGYAMTSYALDTQALTFTQAPSAFVIPADEMGVSNAGGWRTWGGNGYPMIFVNRPGGAYGSSDFRLITGQPNSSGNLVSMYVHSLKLDATGAIVETAPRRGPYGPAMMNTDFPFAISTVAQPDGHGAHLWVFYGNNNLYLWADGPARATWSIGSISLKH